MFEKVKELIVETLNCDAEDITMETDLFEDLEADSLDAVELNLALEEEVGVSIPDEQLKEIRTVGDIVRYLESAVD